MTGALILSELDDFRDLAGMATARLAESIRQGRARDAGVWMRLYERLLRHVSRLEEAVRPAPAPAPTPAPAAEPARSDAPPAADAPLAPAAEPDALDASDSLDRIFFDAVLSAWPSGVPEPGTDRRRTGMAP